MKHFKLLSAFFFLLLIEEMSNLMPRANWHFIFALLTLLLCVCLMCLRII